MSDRAASYIRTFWPLLLGHLAALLVSSVAQRFGVEIDGALAFETVGLVATALMYWVGRQLEHAENLTLQQIGRWIMSANWEIGPPVYPLKTSPSKETDASPSSR